MNYPSIRIEGAILSPDLLDRIEELPGQRPADFNLPTASKVKDEIARAWADAQDYWRIYQRKLDSLREESLATTETRQQWMVPLLGLLGYQLDYQAKAAIIQDKTYAISHRVANRGQTPVHIIGYNDPAGLDRKPDRTTGPRMSAHALVQEYLNLSDELYALVTNGRVLRLLRDSSRLIKLTYLEFDLDRIFTDGLFADFAVLYRLLHASRMPSSVEATAECLIERYHQDSLDSGARIRDGLSKAVEQAIQSFANGLLAHPANADLKAKVESGQLKAEDFYQNLLRLIYRILFLLVIEERNLVYPLSPDNAKQQIYYRYYSLQRLRRLSEKRYLADPRKVDLWHALLNCFRLFEASGPGHKLGIAPLAGDLFNAEAIGPIRDCLLDNETVLGCLRSLNVYHNPETRQTIRVNYAALNVEEFGSVYEGLLEYRPVFFQQGSRWEFAFEQGDDRSNTGSHYTPDDLVQPLLKHSLDYLIADKLKEADKEAALLSLRVADIACGSGHILLAAARRIGTELAIIRTGEDQPSPSALRQAVRDVIRNCIYGVDLNPLAVELCKVALWLEAHVPGQPLNFLDHHIQCGNAIVGFVRQEELEKGIPDEAFKTLPGDDKDIAASYRKQNKSDRKHAKQSALSLPADVEAQIKELAKRRLDLANMPERSPEEIEQKRKHHRELELSKNSWELGQIANIPIAQFYHAKTFENNFAILTDSDFRAYYRGERTPPGNTVAASGALAHRKKFFHWFFHFPEIIEKGGFDCILGNPPYLGGTHLSGTYGYPFCEYVRWQYAPTGLSDLVAFFVRRISSLLNPKGFTAFITTNSIKDGDIRKDGLEQVVAQGGSINFAVRGIKWPGRAKLAVSLVAIYKSKWHGDYVLDNKKVEVITPFFEDTIDLGNPFVLSENGDCIFEGYKPLGDGFNLSEDETADLIAEDPRNREVIFKIINGQELNNSPTQEAEQSIIFFFDRSKVTASKFSGPFKIVEERVKPFRATQNRASNRDNWWQYGEKRPALTRALRTVDHCFLAARTTKYLSFTRASTGYLFSEALKVFTTDRWDLYSVVQSTLHEVWARKYSGALKTWLRYSPSDCFSTFAFPSDLWDEANELLAETGERYHEHRRKTMLTLWIGLTDTYNLFHAPELSPELVAKVSKKPADEAEAGYQAILKLRELHCELDQAVLNAYGWTDLDLGHDYHDLDYLPENDRTRYTISPAARREVLQRLLKLNHERHAEEQAAAATAKPKKKTAKKATRKRKQPEPVPADDLFSPNQKVARAISISAPRDRGLSDEVWWTRFIYAFINESGAEATLSSLDAAWQLMVQRGLYRSEFQATIGDGFSKWNNSLPTNLPNQGFFQHVVDLQSNGLISVARGTWQINIADETRMRAFYDKTGWAEVDVAATSLILERRSDLLQISSSASADNLLNYFQEHAMTA